MQQWTVEKVGSLIHVKRRKDKVKHAKDHSFDNSLVLLFREACLKDRYMTKNTTNADS
jgi:hypothetical protein